MKLKIRDMEAEQENVEDKNPLDLLDISVELGDEDEYPLYQWIMPSHLDDREGNPNPKISKQAQEYGINIEQVLSEEVGLGNDNDSFGVGKGTQSTAGSTRDGDDDSGNDDDGDGGYNATGGYDDGGRSDHEGYMNRPVSPFTCEEYFTHATQDEDHGSRRGGVGIGAIGKQHMSNVFISPQDVNDMSNSFESMNLGTEQSSIGGGSSNMSTYPPWSHGQYSLDAVPQQPYAYPMPGVYVSTQIDYVMPIDQFSSAMNQDLLHQHLAYYQQYYQNDMSWEEYCQHVRNFYSQGRCEDWEDGRVDPPRNSMWF